jgi:hypothetical protein
MSTHLRRAAVVCEGRSPAATTPPGGAAGSGSINQPAPGPAQAGPRITAPSQILTPRSRNIPPRSKSGDRGILNGAVRQTATAAVTVCPRADIKPTTPQGGPQITTHTRAGTPTVFREKQRDFEGKRGGHLVRRAPAYAPVMAAGGLP